MKQARLLPLTALALLLATGCDRKSSEVAKQLADLERKANEAVEKQRQLEQQVEDQKLAAERDAIERERMQIEEDRAELERRQGEASAADEEKLRQRETELANREGRLEMQQSTLEDKEADLNKRDLQLSDRDRDLAGREALIREGDRNDETDVPAADYGMFYDSLSSYGSWFETPDYGYVWQPVIVRDSAWRPYTHGRWVCTDRGWNWLSDEPFGWATYHYGRWALCRGYGWIWVPGCEWAPSWVSWRSSGSHIGWAPLPPESLAYRGSRWDSSVDVTFGIGALWFNFVETRNFGSPIHLHCLPYTQNNLYFGETVNITNIYVQDRRVICGGPRYGDIARQTERRPPFYRIEEDRHGRPGRDSSIMRPRIVGDRLRVTAPNMDVAWNDGLKPNKVKGRMESIQVERTEELRPEVADRFRQSREESRRKADQTIAELGGTEAFRQRRVQQLETNRRQIEEAARPNPLPAGMTKRTEEGRPAGNTPGTGGNGIDGPRIFPPKDGGKQEREQTQRIEEQTPQKQDHPRIPPPKDDLQKQQEAARLRRLQQEQADARQREQTQRREEQTPSRQDQPRIPPPKDDLQKQQEAARLRKLQQEQAEQARQGEETQRRQEQTPQKQDQPRIHPPKDDNRQAQEAAQRLQQMEEARREQQRQQQETAQRQREQARQQQAEESRREQQRQQQEDAQRQREQQRQQQQEESRREQQRQQQEEAQRQREQARQQQQEESRREQQRQQHEEAQRQREQAQQQQRQEEQRQQERARQQQDDDDRKRNGRNR